MSNQETIWASRKTSLLSMMAPKELELLYRHSTRIYKSRGEVIWFSEDEEKKVYIVDQGFIRLCRISQEGKRFTLGILGPGDFYGYLSPKSLMLSQEDVLEVVRDCRMIAIESPIFFEVLAQHPDLALRLAQIMDEQIRGLQSRIAGLLFKDVCARTAESLLELAVKYGEPCRESGAENVYDMAFTHQELADIIGAARQVVSSILSTLQKQGVISKHGKLLCLKDVKALRAISEKGYDALEGAEDK